MTQKPDLKRGQLWWVDLNPTIGSEIQKIRPCLIIQNDTGNRFAATTIIAPLTSTAYNAPIVVALKPNKQNKLVNPSYANLAQIRCIDKQRLNQFIGILSEKEMDAINQAIRKSLSL